jgi:hypothetical protein
VNAQSIRWAQTAGRQRCTNPCQMLTLLTVAANVDRRHEGCALTALQVAAATLLQPVEAEAALSEIADLNLIVPGDQNLSAGYPIEDRPVVWDLNVHGRAPLRLQGRASGHPAMLLPGAVYRFFGTMGQLLYIGTSVEVDQRWTHHVRRHWWTQVVDHEVTWYPTLKIAWMAEQDAIRTEHPLHNVARYRSFGVQAA